MKALNMCFVFIFVNNFLVYVTVNTLAEDIFPIDSSSEKNIISDHLSDDHPSMPQGGNQSSRTEISLLIDNLRNAMFKKMEKLKSHVKKYKLETSQTITSLKAEARIQLESFETKSTKRFETERLKTRSDISKLKEDFKRQLQTERLKASSETSKLKQDMVNVIQNLMIELRKINETFHQPKETQHNQRKPMPNDLQGKENRDFLPSEEVDFEAPIY